MPNRDAYNRPTSPHDKLIYTLLIVPYGAASTPIVVVRDCCAAVLLDVGAFNCNHSPRLCPAGTDAPLALPAAVAYTVALAEAGAPVMMSSLPVDVLKSPVTMLSPVAAKMPFMTHSSAPAV